MDESGFSKCYFREYAYALKGKKVYGKIEGRHYARRNIIAAKAGTSLLAPRLYGGTTTAAFFNEWLEKSLIPATNENQVIIMDNASFHSKKELAEIAKRHNRKIIFLPPYSPELNPIEKYWANLKRYVRLNIKKYKSLDDCICSHFKVN